MRLLLDENMPRLAVEALREAGHDVTWMRTLAPGSADPWVLAVAAGEGRLVITFDKDFGELVFRRSLPAAGVVLFRIDTPSASATANMVTSVLASRDDWGGQFSVIENDRVRQTPLPRPAR